MNRNGVKRYGLRAERATSIVLRRGPDRFGGHLEEIHYQRLDRRQVQVVVLNEAATFRGFESGCFKPARTAG